MAPLIRRPRRAQLCRHSWRREPCKTGARIQGENRAEHDAEISACYRSARDEHGAAATATGHGSRGMEHGPCGCGRRSRSPGGRGRRRLALGGRGTCLSGACHQSCSKCRLRGHETQTRRTSRPACRARATPRDRGRGRTPRPKMQRGQARKLAPLLAPAPSAHDFRHGFPLAACVQHRAGPASSSRSRRRIGARAGGGRRRLARTRRRLRASGARR